MALRHSKEMARMARKPRPNFLALKMVMMALDEMEDVPSTWEDKSLLEISKEYGRTAIRMGVPESAFDEAIKVLEPIILKEFPAGLKLR